MKYSISGAVWQVKTDQNIKSHNVSDITYVTRSFERPFLTIFKFEIHFCDILDMFLLVL